MRLFRLSCFGVLLALGAIAAPPVIPQAAFPDPDSLARELHRLEQAAGDGEIRQIIASLPVSWTVAASGRRYSISTAPLRKLVKSPDQARLWLNRLARELESSSAEPVVASSASSARAQLDRILSRREFAPVRPPTFWERLYQRIVDWIGGIIRRIFDYAKQHPTSGTMLFWLAAAVAVAFLGFWLLRVWSRKGGTPEAQPESAMPLWSWQEWAVSAREARDRGDTRRAIHCAYWAAVVRLQDIQLLPKDLTRTPREYLGLLPDNAPLAALTSAQERFWYAARPASAADLSASLHNLEALGCRID